MKAWAAWAALFVAAAAVAGCEPYSGPTATCFNLLPGEACTFEPLPGADGHDGG